MPVTTAPTSLPAATTTTRITIRTDGYREDQAVDDLRAHAPPPAGQLGAREDMWRLTDRLLPAARRHGPP